MKKIEQQYLKRVERYHKLYVKETQQLNFISYIRILLFLASAVFVFYFYRHKFYYLIISTIAVFILLFFLLVIRYIKVKENRERTAVLEKINEQYGKRIRGEWKEFWDTGEDLKEENHPYTEDLDIFGRGSLFQWISCATTPRGRKRLGDTLSNPAYSIEEIYQRQEALQEFAKYLGWRQRIQAEGQVGVLLKLDPGKLIQWAVQPVRKTSIYFKVGVWLSSAITLGLILGFFTGKLPYYYSLGMLAFQYLLLLHGSKERNEILNEIFQYKKDIQRYEKILKWIEKKKFKSTYLKNLKESLVDDKEGSASRQIQDFYKVVNKISDRQNLFYIILDVVLLWDYHCLWSLEKWKIKSGKHLEIWLEIISEVESLSSLSVLVQDHPQWAMPKINKESLEVSGKEIGHPLLGEKSIKNNAMIKNPSKVLLITGSNMSGKSTFLRTIGINLILSYIGAPVCAAEFYCGKMKVYSCMRVSDNLEKNISSFYAELLRIKEIVAASKEGEPIFFLLDEIFKGTNSKDRHVGAQILIHTLSNRNAIGIVSTHDLELGEMEKESTKIINYHFEEYYDEDEIHFDYKLCRGISTTRNALYLMRMAGIDIQDKKFE